MRPRQNGRHFPDDIFKCIILNENVQISIQISLKFVPECQINNIPALVQIMAWRRSGDKPLSEPLMVSLPTHICVTQPQWVNTLRPRQKNDRHFAGYIQMHFLEWKCMNFAKLDFIEICSYGIPAYDQIMPWRLPGDKPLSEPMMVSLLTHLYMRHSVSMLDQIKVLNPRLNPTKQYGYM